MMEIINKQNLIPDENILIKVLDTHPLCSNLRNRINKTTIIQSSSESIEFDKSNNVTLNLCNNTSGKINYEFILYHEFSHVADRLNLEFKYSNKKKTSLTDKEKDCVMELWNVFIDSRLKKEGLFEYGINDENLWVGKNNNSLSLEGKKLMGHERYLSTRGIDKDKTKEKIKEIWKHPNSFLSYEEMIEFVRSNRAQH